jgi:hypothetical protein
LVVSRVAAGPDEGPEIWIRIRFRLARKVAQVRDRASQSLGGPSFLPRGQVSLTGYRAVANRPFASVRGLDMDDPLGFTPNSRAAGRGWCYGAEVELDLKPLPEARALAGLRSGAAQTVRVVVSSRGGGRTTYAVPIYREGDRRIDKAAEATGCDWP